MIKLIRKIKNSTNLLIIGGLVIVIVCIVLLVFVLGGCNAGKKDLPPEDSLPSVEITSTPSYTPTIPPAPEPTPTLPEPTPEPTIPPVPEPTEEVIWVEEPQNTDFGYGDSLEEHLKNQKP